MMGKIVPLLWWDLYIQQVGKGKRGRESATEQNNFE